MKTARCPICSKTFEVDQTALPPGFPFCSERCRLIDLGRWIDGAYSVPVQPTGPGSTSSADDPSRAESDQDDEVG